MVYPIGKIFWSAVIKIWLKKVTGISNIPKNKPFVFCSNHASFLDDFIIPAIIVKNTNKLFHIYVNSRFYKSRILRKFFNYYNCLPVYVEKHNYSKEKNEATFQKALTGLQNNKLILIFPEGRRSIDGELQKGKPGAARLALSAKVPILPIGEIGSYELFPKGNKFPKLKRKIIVNIGKPLYLNKYYGKEKDKDVLEEVTRIIMKEIAKLSKQEYRY